MATELYDLTIPVFIRNFGSLSTILAKGEAFAVEQGIEPGELVGARLIADMAPLSQQVQICSDTARGTAMRVGGIENVAMPDEEKTFAELQDRIARTVDFLKSVSPDAMNGREDAKVEFKTPTRTLEFTGRSYVLGFALPNFYFHMTTAYAILRMKGVPVGKMDFLGGV